MPVDEAGNRADIVMDPYATVNRMNLGRVYELYYNAASRDVVKNILKELGDFDKKHPNVFIENLFYSDNVKFDKLYRYLMGFYNILSPKMFKWFAEDASNEEKINHLASVVKDGIYLYMPTESNINHKECVLSLEKYYKPTYGPVTYVGNSGNKVTTKVPVRIGSVFFMLLEKTGEDYSATASGKLQNFGVLAQITKNDKYTSPIRSSPVRVVGESEGRIFAAYAGQKAIAELIDRNNTPSTHKAGVMNILSSEKPTNIDKLVDREKHLYGGSKPLSMVKHVLQCAGIKFVYSENVK